MLPFLREIRSKMSSSVRELIDECEDSELFEIEHAILTYKVEPRTIKTGPITLNLNHKNVTINHQPLHLTMKEYQILELLSIRKGMPVSSEMMLNHLYNGMDEPEAKIINIFIFKLRKKIAHMTGGPNHIRTIYGRGYSLVEEETTSEQH